MSNAKGLLDFIGSAAKEFFADLSESNLVEKILKLSVKATGADRGTIFIDPDFQMDLNLKYLMSYIATGIEKQSIVVNVKQGIAGKVFCEQKSYISENAQTDPNFYPEVDKVTGYTTRNILAVPLHWKENKVIGVLQVLNKKDDGFDLNDQHVLEFISILATIAIENYEIHQKAIDHENEVLHQKHIWAKRLDVVLQNSKNPQIQSIYENIPTYAKSDSSILITGESGTGKEVFARLIHSHSARNNGPFVAINCAAIPESLIEAELFGVAKGAATGTIARKGQIELAHRGTLFLDEIGEMPLEMQAKLLRVLQERKVSNVGSTTPPKAVDFRLLCATNKNLDSMIKEKKFREDLFYRVCVVHLMLPSLKERIQDLPELIQSIIQNLHLKRGWKIKSLSPGALVKLQKYTWPGNIRELENKIENALLLSGESPMINEKDIQLPIMEEEGVKLELITGAQVSIQNEVDYLSPYQNLPFKEAKSKFEMELVNRTIEQFKGNKSEAARFLGLSREGLRKIITKNTAAA